MSEIIVPQLGESIVEGTIAAWLKNPGDTVQEGEPIVQLETDKVNLEINAESSGVLQKVLRQTGETVQVGEAIGIIDEAGTAAEAPAAATQPAAQAQPQPETQEKTALSVQETKQQDQVKSEEQQKDMKNPPLASPAARRYAREHDIDLQQLRGQDPLGRITADNMKNIAEQPKQSTPPAPAASLESKPLAAIDDKPAERIRMTRRRITIANRLVEAQRTAAMLTTFNEVDMTAIMAVRQRRKDSFYEKHNVRLGFMSFFTKASVAALKEFPLINAEIQNEEILMKKYYDIGVAVSTPEGLVVPVVRNADKLSFAGIESEIGRLAEKARNNALTLPELQGGTFTITNGGIFGSLLSTPILNTPQVAILGMHKIQLRPVAIDKDTMENRPMMYVALSYDHRIVDGREAVSFLVRVKELLEDPESLLLEG